MPLQRPFASGRSTLPEGRLLLLPGLSCLLAFSLGCANPGSPRPPSLHLPSLAQKVTAERSKDQVLLNWFTPSTTTDGDSVRTSITAVVCREVSQPTSVPAPQRGGALLQDSCKEIQRLSVNPGAQRTVDPLPSNFRSGRSGLLTYRVELLNDRRRSAGLSAPAFAASGAAPAPVGPITVTPRRDGLLITWRPEPVSLTSDLELPPSVVELKRSTTSNLPAPGENSRSAIAPTQRASRHLPAMNGRNVAGEKGQGDPQDVLLRSRSSQTSADRNGAPDPNGLIDKSVIDGLTYTYIAQRVRTEELAGHQLELRGDPSPPATLTFKQLFPPDPPRGLLSVRSSSFSARPAIDLSWEPGAESDLIGYNLYRRDNTNPSAPLTPFVLLNHALIQGAAFHDPDVLTGHSYLYRVTSVDEHLKESAPSAEIQEAFDK